MAIPPAIPLVSPEEVQKGRGGKTKGEKYAKYAQAIAPHIPWFKSEIDKAPCPKETDIKSIRMKVIDTKKAMGLEFEKKSDKAIYWGLKFVLFHEGIVVTTGKSKDGSALLVMRFSTDKDELPPSQRKYLEPEEELMPEIGTE